jgi:uncharacterized protein (DUF2252 family)
MGNSTKEKRLIRPDQREKVLLGARNRKMARSAHAFVRGSTASFYDWLQKPPVEKIPAGPSIWICGDCHVGNLGPIAHPSGRVDIQIRDLDQTVIGNPAHDLIRLGLSLASAARGSDLPGVTTAKMMEQLIEGYELAFADKDATGTDSSERPASVHIVMKEAANRSWKKLARERLENTKPTIPLGKRFWPLMDEERQAIRELFGTGHIRRLATMLRSRDDDAPVELIDAAYWMKGCSSLGALRFAALLEVGRGKDRQICLMDIKEAVAPAAPHDRNAQMPADNGERVVEGARHLSPNVGERMRSARLLDRSVFIRELLPQDLKLEIAQLSQDEAIKAARFLAGVVGTAHARQMDGSTQKAWLNELQRNRAQNIDAPSWLWKNIVELMASHEGAYLEHCRQYALNDAV